MSSFETIQEASVLGRSEYFEAHPEDIEAEYMNNFYLWMPGSKQIKNFESFKGGMMMDEHREGSREGHSEVWFNQTLREYIQVVEETAKEIPGMMDIIEIINPNTAFTHIQKNEELIPLYIALRKKGYTHLDLVQ